MANDSVKTVVLLRGGIDSTILLAKAVADNGSENVAALTLYYGQKTKREREMAMKSSAHYGVKHIELDISKVMDFSDCSALAANPLEPGEDKYQEQTEVPFRNGLMMAVAASVAQSLGAETVQYAVHNDDKSGLVYPDCREEFFRSMADAISKGTGGKIGLEFPFIDMSKKEVMELGKELGTPFDMTWSCFVNDDEPCGYCVGCVGRDKAFASIGEKDPLKEK